MAGIRVLCTSLNLIKYSSHLKENIKKKTFYSPTKFIETCLFFMLAMLQFTDNSSSFCYSYLAAEVPFQFIKNSKCIMFTQVVSISIESGKSTKHLNYSLHLNYTAVFPN